MKNFHVIAIGKTSSEKNISFGHCPNHPPPPPQFGQVGPFFTKVMMKVPPPVLGNGRKKTFSVEVVPYCHDNGDDDDNDWSSGPDVALPLSFPMERLWTSLPAKVASSLSYFTSSSSSSSSSSLRLIWWWSDHDNAKQSKYISVSVFLFCHLEAQFWQQKTSSSQILF